MKEADPIATPSRGGENPFAAPRNQEDATVQQPADGVAHRANLATRRNRLIAALIDQGVLVPAAVVLAMGLKVDEADKYNMALVTVGLLGVAAILILQTVFLTTRGQSLGKMARRIRIVRLDGSRPGFVHAVLLRSWAPSVINCVPYVAGIFGFIDVLFIYREDQRCVHDLMADTTVVNVQTTP